ncbi:MAG TPA: PEPxxWA-CTERM sorting domain-containing protein [Caulobacteraceae bacterium]|jgi:hypothetical protein
MRAIGLVKLLAGTALVATLGLATVAQAAVDKDIPGTGFAGIAGDGNSGTDAFGQPWNWGTTAGVGGVPAGLSSWGNPGLGDGEINGYNGSIPATDFFVSFLTSEEGTYIREDPSPMVGGYDEETRFTSCNTSGGGCVAWTPVYDPAVNPLEVNFIAPAGTELVKGDFYFVNVVFTTGNLTGGDAGFSAVFSSTVPEASTWAMMIFGIAGVGGALRSSRRNQRTSFIGA